MLLFGYLCLIFVVLKVFIVVIKELIEEGDILVMNDFYFGGMYLFDIFIFKLVFVEGEIVVWVCVVCYYIDVGGWVVGLNVLDSIEIY